jgi:hypothetical protein
MPAILQQDGFPIRMFLNDHEPPHVHARNDKALVVIRSAVAEGQVPSIRTVRHATAELQRSALREVTEHNVFSWSSGVEFMAKRSMNSKTVPGGRFILTEAEIERQIAEATRRGEKELRTEPLATSARFDRRSRRVVIELNKGGPLRVPVDLLQGLAGASLKDLSQFENPSPDREIEWPALDQQFTIQGLLAGRFGTRSWTEDLERNGQLTRPQPSPKIRANRLSVWKGRRIRKTTAAANA